MDQGVVATGLHQFHSFDATRAFNPSGKEGGYNAPMENIDADLMPSADWSTAAFVPDPKVWLPSNVQHNSSLAERPPSSKATLPLNISTGREPSRFFKHLQIAILQILVQS